MDEAAEAKTSLLKPGRNCWTVGRAGRAALIVDAADYYRQARQAILRARSQIMLIGWDVDTRVALDDEQGSSGAPVKLGPLLSWVAKKQPDLKIYILAWDEGLISLPGRGTTLLRMLRWWLDPSITIKWDSTHPLDASHHQKILVIDDSVAFCGGIDITAERWDTRDHRDDEPGRRRPFTRRAYEPWHDAIMAVDGDAARALGECCRKRWDAATSNDCLPAPEPGADRWPPELEPAFRDVDVAIARTRGHEGPNEEVREIEALFLDLIAAAERFVYLETQYFASRVVAEAIAKRLEQQDGPEFVIVNPKTAEGWLDEAVMGPARYELMHALKARDRHGRFRIYTPVTEGGADIYVHAKVMIVDDRYLRVGSANLNNRSMGLDSECDLLIDGSGRDDVRRTIGELRCDMIAEHLGVERHEVAGCVEETGSLIGAIEKLRGRGRTLVPFDPPEPGPAEKAIARSQLLDPEAPNELFDPKAARPGLLSRLRKRQRR
jgi:phospholipase D1/2